MNDEGSGNHSSVDQRHGKPPGELIPGMDCGEEAYDAVGAEATAKSLEPGTAEAEAGADVERDLDAGMPVVGIGASAGGLEAFREFFSHMPAESGMAFVLVQHLDPKHKSMLSELLARFTTMPVVQVSDGMELEPNTVFLIPPDATLTIEDSTLRLSKPAPPRGQRTPIDTFFCALAEDQGENAIGIVLSGTGSDGTVGVRAIKEHGGLAIAQESESAKYDSMPRSAVATGLVDRVLPVGEMPGALIGYFEHRHRLNGIKGVDGLREEAVDHLAKICNLLKTRTGHDFRDYKENTFIRRIQRRMQVLRLEEVADYVDRLRKDPAEAPLLFRDLLIGVTHFFRDTEAFRALEERVVPKILDNAASRDVIRVWVPGCATGEEAYSLAIMLRRAMDDRDVLPRLQVFATDIDEEALKNARRAVYPDSIAGFVPDDLLKRFFRAQGTHYQVVEEIREMCIFSLHSMIKDPPFSKLDLVSCRNLLIYLKNDVQKRLVPLFHYALKPGGYLFLGPSENVSAKPDLFSVVDRKWRIFMRRDDVVRPPVQFAQQLSPRHPPTELHDGPTPDPREGPRDLASMVERAVLDGYAPAYVLVNGERDILYASSRTSAYLELPKGPPNLSLLNLAKPGLQMDLRAVLHEAIRDGRPAVRDHVQVQIGGEIRILRLMAQPLQGDNPDDHWLVVFHDCGVAGRADGRREPPPPEERPGNVEALEAELRATKHYLQTVTEELESSNEELKSSNEELMSMNEELQSSNEELETSKEELQSVNEELETVNAELSSKVDQLAAANSDLRNLFESTQVACVFLGPDLRIRNFTPQAREIFHLIDSDRNRPIGDIAVRLAGVDATADSTAVLESLSTIEREVALLNSDASFIMRVFPYRTVNNQIDGVVMTFTDVTRQKRAQRQIEQLNQDIAVRLNELEALLELVPVGIALAEDPSCERIRLNRRAGEILREQKVMLPSGVPGSSHRVIHHGREVTPEDLPLQRAIRRNEPVHSFEATICFLDGTTTEVITSAAPVRHEDGSVRGAVAAFEDITPLKDAQLEAEARATQNAAIAKLGREGLGQSDTSELMREAVDLSRRILLADCATVFKLDREHDRMTAVAVSGSQQLTVDATGAAARGSLAAFALQSREPVVVEDLAAERRFERPTLLSGDGVVSAIAVVIGDHDDAYGILGVFTRSRRLFSAHDVNFVQAVANVLAHAVHAKAGAQRQDMLLGELQHRVKNTLAIVQSLAAQTLRRADGDNAAAEAFQDRLQALARAHNLITDDAVGGVFLRDLLDAVLAPFSDVASGRIAVTGDGAIRLTSTSIVSMAMAIHELATNATKYGALALPGGHVELAYRLVEGKPRRTVQLRWTESGGPPVTPPEKPGFGLQFVERGLKHNLGAAVSVDFKPSGLECTIAFPYGG